jgi:hypothetical protein
MTDQTCPKCGADAKEKHMEWTRFECGTANVGRRIVEDGYDCYENQLATQTARAIRLMRMVEDNDLHWSELIGAEKEKNTHLRGLLGEIRERLADGYLYNLRIDLGQILDRINEGSE